MRESVPQDHGKRPPMTKRHHDTPPREEPGAASEGRAEDARAERLGADPSATERAFVVHLAPEDEAERTRFSGRVHHLATLDGGNFASVEGLIAIMRGVLDRARRQRSESS